MTAQLRKLLLRFGLVLLAGVVCSTLSFAQRHAARQFERGEELVYEAEFSRALLRGIDVADFRLSASG